MWREGIAIRHAVRAHNLLLPVEKGDPRVRHPGQGGEGWSLWVQGGRKDKVVAVKWRAIGPVLIARPLNSVAYSAVGGPVVIQLDRRLPLWKEELDILSANIELCSCRRRIVACKLMCLRCGVDGLLIVWWSKNLTVGGAVIMQRDVRVGFFRCRVARRRDRLYRSMGRENPVLMSQTRSTRRCCAFWPSCLFTAGASYRLPVLLVCPSVCLFVGSMSCLCPPRHLF